MSPLVITLSPPEALVLEVRTTGRFFFQQWSRNGVSLSTPSQHLDFGDVYITAITTTADLGPYELNLVAALGSGQTVPATILFYVVEEGRRYLAT